MGYRQPASPNRLCRLTPVNASGTAPTRLSSFFHATLHYSLAPIRRPQEISDGNDFADRLVDRPDRHGPDAERQALGVRATRNPRSAPGSRDPADGHRPRAVDGMVVVTAVELIGRRPALPARGLAGRGGAGPTGHGAGRSRSS